MMKTEHYDHFYMDLAKRIASMSYATRKQVGCVIVSNDNILSYGWNGMPRGMDNTCEDENGFTHPEVSHAEENAIGKLAKSNNSSNGAVMYCTLQPCIHCAKLINTAGIWRVVYEEEYRDVAGLIFLKQRGIVVDRLAP